MKNLMDMIQISIFLIGFLEILSFVVQKYMKNVQEFMPIYYGINS